MSQVINWRFINLNIAFREVVGEPSRTFLVYSDLVNSNIVGGQQYAIVREVECRRQGKGMAYFEPLHIDWLEVEIAESHRGLVKFGTGRTLITFVFKRDVQKRHAHRGNVSNHVGRQSDAVPSTIPAAAGWEFERICIVWEDQFWRVPCKPVRGRQPEDSRGAGWHGLSVKR